MYRIAICEDDKNYIVFLKKIILATNVIEPETILFYDFHSGEELFLHSELDFDLVILDMQMDKMDGYETAMQLRKIDQKFFVNNCKDYNIKFEKYSFCIY